MASTIISLRQVYREEIVPVKNYSLVDTMRTYSFGWQYDGSRGYVEVCPGSIAVLWEEEGRIIVDIYAGDEKGCWEERVRELPRIIGADERLDEYFMLATGDPLVSCIARRMRGLRLRSTDIFYAFLVAVAQQHASFKQGWRSLHRLHLFFSPRYILRLPSGEDHVFLGIPGPRVLVADPQRLKETGLGYRVRTVLAAARSGVFDDNPVECSVIDEQLSRIRGVGSYTLRLIRLLACRDYRSPPLDQWFTRLAAAAYNVHVDSVLGELTSRFGVWSGLAVYHTTIAFDAEPFRRALARLRKRENCPGLVKPAPVNMWEYFVYEPVYPSDPFFA